MKFDAVAVIVAGGKSTRMQKDKALLPFGELSSLAQFQYARLSQLFSEVYLSSKSNKFDFEVRVIEDKYEVSSPLVALISIFETLTFDEVFVLSVDAPFVDKSVMIKLYEEAELCSDIIVVKSKNGLEPLCAIYRRTFLKKAKIALSNNRHKLHALFDELTVQSVEVEEDVFMNLNYPHEYEEALKR